MTTFDEKQAPVGLPLIVHAEIKTGFQSVASRKGFNDRPELRI